MNSQKITNLAAPTLSTDGVNKAYVDSNSGISQSNADARYYLNNVPLNSITAPASSLSMNSQKITNLSSATLATDALNMGTADSRYYKNTVTLDNVTTPSNSLSMNSQKITNLANATLATDALNRQTGDARYYL